MELKFLTELCVKSGNYQKLHSTYLILIGNEVDKISVKLGIKKRDKTKRDLIYRQMAIINEFLTLNLRLTLFKVETIDKIKKVETQLLQQRIAYSKNSCSELCEIYFDLRKIAIPNMYKSTDLSDFPIATNYRALGSNTKKNKKKSATDQLKPLILQKIKTGQAKIQKEIARNGYRDGLLERSLRLKEAERIVKEPKEEKTRLKEKLKDNLQYQIIVPDLIKYFILSLTIFFGALGVVVGIEATTYSYALNALSLVMVLFFGACISFFIVYHNLYERED